MISFHHSFSTRIFLNETSSPERAARRAAAGGTAAGAPAKEEARAANELREFWWFLRSAKGDGKMEGRAPARPRPGGRPTLRQG
ncbi:MAG: hypothetical protein WDM96_01905 [Lacunisphaera sp.]